MGFLIKFLMSNKSSILHTIFNGGKEKYFNKTNAILLLLLALFIAIFVRNNIVAWLALTIAMFSSIGNDSIQTLGTFLAANSKTAWWKLAMYIGFIFVTVVVYGWYNYDGEIHFDRLRDITGNEHIHTLQFFAPIVLVFLTIFGIPVSTTFLILSTFATQEAVQAMLAKTFIAYSIAFMSGVGIWFIIYKYFANYFLQDSDPKNELKWKILQWFSTGMLWTTWLVQNTSNVAVFLPRKFDLYNLIVFLCIGLFAIFFVLFNGGGPIQEIVSEKKDVIRAKSGAFINLAYALILFVFKEVSTTPMATTWVFLGLLGGREFAISYFDIEDKKRYAKAAKIISKDIALASLGILISLLFVYLSKGYTAN
jgi:hypothetical protein